MGGVKGLLFPYNASLSLPANTIQQLEFLDASGNPSRAIRVIFIFETDLGFGIDSRFRITEQPGHASLADPTNSNMGYQAGMTDLSVEGVIFGKIKIFNNDPAINATLQVKAYSDIDISGTAWTP